MVTRLRNINPVQFGLVYGIVAAFIALIVALLALPFGALMGAAGGRLGMFGAGMGVMFIVLAPIMYFCVGFVGGLVTAFVYNIVAVWTGGVEVTLSGRLETAVQPPQGYTV
ncbi:MAG: hypothetical protein ABR508_04605 [Candidatus Baltobacteraceae bacterium]